MINEIADKIVNDVNEGKIPSFDQGRMAAMLGYERELNPYRDPEEQARWFEGWDSYDD